MTPAAPLRRAARPALVAGAAGLVVTLVLGATIAGDDVFLSCLYAFLVWYDVAAGCLALLALYHLAPGRWGLALRRLLEAGALTFPLLALLFLPVLFGTDALYPWARAGAAADPNLVHKARYLNVPFWTLRSFAYLALFSVLGIALAALSRRQDAGDAAATAALRKLSAATLVLYVLFGSFAAVDWGMALEPKWFSTMYGLLYVVGQPLQALALLLLVLLPFGAKGGYGAHLRAQDRNDLGNLLLALVILWGYVTIMQWIILWNTNLSDEIPWYVRRARGGWQGVAVLLALAQFAVPFAALLFRGVKRGYAPFFGVAATVAALKTVEQFWLVAPAHRDHLYVAWTDVPALVGAGGLWAALFLWNAARRPLVAPRDPVLAKQKVEGYGV